MPFFTEPNPVAALFRGFQAFLGTAQTGVWDRATHEALAGYITARGTGKLPPWGTPGIDVNLIWRPEDLAGRTGPLDSVTARMAEVLGLPSDTYENLLTFLSEHEAEIIPVLAEANRQIDATEAAAAAGGSPGTRKWLPWVVGIGVVTLGIGAVILLGRKKEG